MSTDFSAFLKFDSIWGRIKEVAGDATQTQIGAMAGVTSGAVSNWKKEEKIPFEPLFRFALANKVSVHWLLTGEGEKIVSRGSQEEITYVAIKRKGGGEITLETLSAEEIALRRQKIADTKNK